MMHINRSVISLMSFMLALAITPSLCMSQELDGTLHVLRPVIHAERAKAEICLEFDHVLEEGHHARLVSTVHLETESKKQILAPQNVNVDGNSLCVQGLDHRRDYRISIGDLHGTKGEKLSSAYSLSFTVPDRHAALNFTNNALDNGLVRWHGDDPILHAVNIDQVHIDAYRITDPKAMVEAWHQRLQTTLAPSESAYFAQHNGQYVGGQDIVLNKVLNKDVEQPVALDKIITSPAHGLYLIIASAPSVAQDASVNDDKTKKTLPPMTAEWLLRSDLEMHIIRSKDGYYALTESDNGAAPLANVRTMIHDRNQQVLVEGQTDANGMALLGLTDATRGEASTLLGLTTQGDIAFVDLNPNAPNPFTLPDFEASLATDKAFYFPEDFVNVTLAAHDIHGQALAVKDSILQIRRPDQSIFTTLSVPSDANGLAHVGFAAPVANGMWSLVWVRSNGSVLAKKDLRITINSQAPHFDVVADRAMLPDDGSANLTIKSLGADGRAASYMSGHVAVSWIVPTQVFPNFKGYTFGMPDRDDAASIPVTSFITDEKGVAHVPINLKQPSFDTMPLRAASLMVAGDPAAGIIAAAPLVMPLTPKNYIIGIKADAVDNRFPENSLAHFSVIAVDAGGKRIDVENLSYQISEEGRHFDWYPSEGRWDYKPLRQEHHLGGAPLTLSAQDSNIIEWPVTAGNYRLNIMDANGSPLAQMSFSAGWGMTSYDHPSLDSLTLVPPKDILHTGQTASVHFNLPRVSLVTAIIADDHVRDVIHVLKPAGNNSIEFVPQKDWGARVSVWVNAPAANMGGQIVMTSLKEQETQSTIAKAAQPASNEPLGVTAGLPALFKPKDVVKISVDFKNNLSGSGIYHYVLTPSAGIDIAGPTKNAITLAAGQHKTLSFTLKAVQDGAQSLRLDVTGPHGLSLSRNWFVTVMGEVPELIADDHPIKIAPQQNATIPALNKTLAVTPFNPVLIAPRLPGNVTGFLSGFLHIQPFTTPDLAAWLEEFRRWHSMITQTGLLSEEAASIKQQDILLQLLARQSPDGGFPALPKHVSDLESTSAAVMALIDAHAPVAKPALDQAVGWLQHYLENTWFDESERPLRAAAYAALTAANHVDISSLYYFSDNSKNLSPLAAAQLAAAFVKIDDQPKAQYWLKTITPSDENPEKLLRLQAVLAANPLVNADDIVQVLEKVSPLVVKTLPQNTQAVAAFLQAVYIINDRVGPWHAAINGADRVAQGVYFEKGSDKSITIRNLFNQPLSAVQAYQTSDVPAVSVTVNRHIYRIDGTAMDETRTFDRDGIYVMVLEGTWPKDDTMPLVVHDEASMAMMPVSCALSNEAAMDGALAWLKHLSLSPVAACEISRHAIHVNLDARDNEQPMWRIAYLVKSEWGGTFGLSMPSVSP